MNSDQTRLPWIMPRIGIEQVFAQFDVTAFHRISIQDAGASGDAFPRWSVGTIDARISQRTDASLSELTDFSLLP
jgi:hypothetical protein